MLTRLALSLFFLVNVSGIFSVAFGFRVPFGIVPARAQAQETLPYSLILDTKTQLNNTTESDLRKYLTLHLVRKLPKAWTKALTNSTLKISFVDSLATDGFFFPSLVHGRPDLIAIRKSVLETRDFWPLLSHEWFHFAHHRLRPRESPWLKEALAGIFEFQTTSNLHFKNTTSALTHSKTQLADNSRYKLFFDSKDAPQETKEIYSNQYGHDFLFLFYLLNRSEEKNAFFWSLASPSQKELASPETPITGWSHLRQVFQENRFFHGESLEDLIADFQISRVHNRMTNLSPNASNPYFLLYSPKDFSDFSNSLEEINSHDPTSTLKPYVFSNPLLIQEILKTPTPQKQRRYLLQREFPFQVFENPDLEALSEVVVGWLVILNFPEQPLM